MDYYKKVIILFFFLVLISSISVKSDTFVDDTEAEFDLGTYNNTYWNGTHVELNYTNESKELSVPDPWFDMSGLQGYWKLNGNGNDSSSYNNDLIIQEAISTSAKLDKGYRILDQIQNITTVNTTRYGFNTTNLSIFFWVNASTDWGADDTDRHFLYKYSRGALTQNQWIFKIDSAGSHKLQFACWTGAGAVCNSYGTKINWVPHQWYFIGITYNSTHYEFWVDGESDGATYDLDTPTDYNATLVIGGKYAEAAGDNNINSTMDEISIWNRSLSKDEIQSYYNRTKGKYTTNGNYKKSHNATAVDWDGMIYDGTSSGSYVYSTNYFNYTMLFTGTGTDTDYLKSVTVMYDYPNTFRPNITAGMEWLTFNWTQEQAPIDQIPDSIYGGMWYHNSTGTTIPFTNADTWYPLYFTNATDLSGFSYVGGFNQSSNLTANISGKYQASYMAIGSGQNNHVYLTTIFVDGVSKPKCGNHHKMAAGGDVITQGGVCIITIDAGQTVGLYTQDMGGTGDGEYYGGNLNLVILNENEEIVSKNIQIQLGLDNITFNDITYLNETNRTGYQFNLFKDEIHYIRSKNSTTSWYYTTQLTEGGSEDNYFYIYIIGLFMFIVLITLTEYTESPIFAIFGGMISIVMAVGIIGNTFVNLSNTFLKTSIVVVLLGMGFYYIVAPTINWMEKGG